MKRLTVAAAVLSTVFMSAGAFADTDRVKLLSPDALWEPRVSFLMATTQPLLR